MANRDENFCGELDPANLGDQVCAKTIAQAQLAGRVRDHAVETTIRRVMCHAGTVRPGSRRLTTEEHSC